MQPANLLEYEHIMAIVWLGQYRKALRRWVDHIQNSPTITAPVPNNLFQEMYNTEKAYEKLLSETGRIN